MTYANTFKLLLVSISCLMNTYAVAGGFQVNLQGQKQTGMGHTGTGLALDNAALVFNPGALIFVDSLGSISMGAALIFPRTLYLDPNSTYREETVHHTGTPLSIYAHFKFSKKSPLSFGFGLYNPFGSRIEWPDQWKGKFLIREINLRTFFYQPTLSYRVNDKLGIGIGYIYANGDFTLRKAIPVQDSLRNYGEALLKGKASGQGYNAGIYYKPTPTLSFGLNYRSAVRVKVSEGNASFVSAPAVATYFQNTAFTTHLNLPAMTTFGVGYLACNKFTLAADINYVSWSSYDSLIIDFKQNSDKLKDIASPRLYKNSFIYRLGLQYKINETLQLRCGVYYDQSPVKNDYVTPETPDSDKIGLSTGLSATLLNFLYIDASLLLTEGKKRTTTNIETQFEAIYKSRALIPGINIGIKF